MKKLLLSILIVGSATLANAQKSEVAEAKKSWSLFQLTLSTDPNKKAADGAVVNTDSQNKELVKKRESGSVTTTGSSTIPVIPGKRKGGLDNTPGGTAYVEPTKKAPAAGSFVEKQINHLKEGLSHTDKAIANEKSKDLVETWVYRALFSATIAAVDSLDVQNSIANEKIALEALAKARALDTKNEEKANIDQAQANLDVALSVRAITAYNKKDYTTAYTYFSQLAAKNPTDASMALNVAVTSKLLEKYPEAIADFKKVLNLNTPDSKEIYYEVINIALEKTKDTTTAFALIKDAMAKFPDDAGLIGMETDLYITRGDIAKSQELLNKLIAKDPKKEVYQYLMGNTYFNSALAIQKERDKLDAKKVKEYNAATAKVISMIDQSMPYYLKALEINPAHASSLDVLSKIYAFKGDTKNSDEMKKRLDAIPAKN